MSDQSKEFFNKYLLQAVAVIHKKWSRKGYASAAYTHDLILGTIKMTATKPPFTMCVAAQLEVIVTALNLYVDDTGDKDCLSFLPARQWTSLAPGTFKDLVWVNSGSRGTADALEKYGMGRILPFKDLLPGSFVNLNRKNGSGHATLFIGFLDVNGKIVEPYSDRVVGFKYYSSQGKAVGGGFDYRYAFFEDICPALPASKKRDCGVMRSDNQEYLNTGFMLTPNYWDETKRDKQLQLQDPQKMIENNVNPAYEEQLTTDD